MIWQIYGGLLLVVPAAALLNAMWTSTTQEARDDPKIGFAAANFSLYLPLAGHLVGLW